MPENDVWPPKPDLPDPLTEYDDVIAAKLAALPEAKRSRLLLTKALRDEKGMDLRQAYTFVTSYCDRHKILVRPRTSLTMAWLRCLVPLLAFCLAVFNIYLGYQRDAILRLPHHHGAFLALRREQLSVVYVLVTLVFLNLIVQVMRFRASRKK